MKSKYISVANTEAGERLDLFLVKKMAGISRNFIVREIKNGHVKVNDKIVKASYILKTDDEIELDFDKSSIESPIPTGEDIKLNIVYEDNNVIVINKPSDLVVHPGTGNRSKTLVNALIKHYPKIKDAVYDQNNIISTQRPGIVHRLDKDTSGLIVAAKNIKALKFLSREVKNRKFNKIYWALCFGWPKNSSGCLINYLGRHPKKRLKVAEIGKEKGREAILNYKVLQEFKYKDNNNLSLIEFNIKTGRTHQIRVQSSIMDNPVMGDLLYGNKLSKILAQKFNIKRQLLHAKILELYLPEDKKRHRFEAPLPDDFVKTISVLKKIND